MGIKDYTVLELLNLINKELDKGLSLNKISENLKIPSSSIRTKLKDYRYNKGKNKYILKDNTTTTQINYNDKTSYTNISKELKTQINYNTNTNDLTEENIKDLLELIKMKSELKLLIKENKKHKVNDIIENKLKDNIKVTHNAKQRMIRVDKEVLKEWDNFISENKDFKVQDLYSLALKEFLFKYSKN